MDFPALTLETSLRSLARRATLDKGKYSIIPINGGQTRAFAGQVLAAIVPGNLSPPTTNAADYLLAEKCTKLNRPLWFADTDAFRDGKGLDASNMLEDWSGSARCLGEFLALPGVGDLVKAIHGKRYRILMDRAWQQPPRPPVQESRKRKRAETDKKKLATTFHVDYPQWKKIKADSLPGPVPTCSVAPPRGSVAVCLLRIDEPHGIPAFTTGPEPTLGPFVSVVPKTELDRYGKATSKHLATQSRQIWAPLTSDHFVSNPFEAVAAALFHGGRAPAVYPGGKFIAMPAPYNANRYPYMVATYFPPTAEGSPSAISSKAVLASIQAKFPSIAHYFLKAATLRPQTTVDCSQYPHLPRYFP